MPHPMFVRHVRKLEPLRAERMLDAAQAASVPHMGKEAAGWFDRMLATARGVAASVATAVAPLFTWNNQPVRTSSGLRQKFGEHVSSKVES